MLIFITLQTNYRMANTGLRAADGIHSPEVDEMLYIYYLPFTLHRILVSSRTCSQVCYTNTLFRYVRRHFLFVFYPPAGGSK